MAKRSGLAVLALIIALGALGIGGYSFILVQMGSGVHRTYNDENKSTYTSTAEDTWYAIPDLSVSFQVDGAEHVYFSFTCYASLTPSSSICRMNFRLFIDSVAADDSLITVGGTSMPANTLLSVSLQYFETAIGAGIHTVVVQTMRECDGFIDNCYLLVQTYTP